MRRRFRAYRKKLMYAYGYGAALPWWKRKLAEYETRRRMKIMMERRYDRK